jgi:hypothetical protein
MEEPMSGFAALAVKEAAVASGLGTAVLPGIAPSALDGFAVGTLLCGVCFVLVKAPRRMSRRSKRSARGSMLTSAAHNPMTPDLSGYAAVKPAHQAAGSAANAGPFADESAEMVISLSSRDEMAKLAEMAQLADAKNCGKHRLSSAEVPERRPELKRGSGRHAAPPAGVGSRMASKFAGSAVMLRD